MWSSWSVTRGVFWSWKNTLPGAHRKAQKVLLTQVGCQFVAWYLALSIRFVFVHTRRCSPRSTVSQIYLLINDVPVGMLFCEFTFNYLSYRVMVGT